MRLDVKMETSFLDKSCRNALAWLVVGVMGCVPAWAQSAAAEAPGETNASVQALMKRIEELEASQRQMQMKINQLTAGPTSSSVPAPAPEPVTQEAPIVSDDEVTNLGPLKIQAFGDFNFGRPWFQQVPPGGLAGTTNSFTVGDFDLFTNTHIADHWSVLGEMLVTSDFSNETSVEMDRLLLIYNANPYLRVSFGKYNTALGYYTNAFHRAHFFQTTVSRPIMYADEDDGGILPVHNIGVTATGKIPSGRLGLHWVAEMANGRSETREVAVQNFEDENNGKAVNFAFYTAPEGLPGFQAGVSIYRDTIHPSFGPSLRETIPAGYIVYVGTKLEFLNEIAVMRHSVLDGNQVYHAVTGYSQISWGFGGTRPYFRYDYQNIAASDPIFGFLGRESGPSIGLERRVSRFLVVKSQYGRFTQGERITNALNGQFAFAF